MFCSSPWQEKKHRFIDVSEDWQHIPTEVLSAKLQTGKLSLAVLGRLSLASLCVVAGSRSCEILVLEWRVTERLPFFKVEPAGSAVLALLLKIICFHAQCLQRGVCLPWILSGS